MGRLRNLSPANSVDLAGIDERLLRIVTLQDYNTRVVLLGTVLLGITAAVVGVFMLLRRRALVGDVIGHSALPGIAGAFLVMEIVAPGGGRSLPALLAGAFVAGLSGAMCVMAIDRYSRIKSDAALAIVLSVFFGAGAVLLSAVQKVPTGSAAGLSTFLNGKTASLVASDVAIFAGTGLVVLALTVLLFKELTLLCFDEAFAAAQGWPVVLLDGVLIALVVAVTIIGMQSVGLILVVATLITPAAAARFWTDDIRKLTLLAALIGGVSAVAGVTVSAVMPRVAAGAVIVLSAGLMFAISLLIGGRRGVVWRWLKHLKLQRSIPRLDLMRGIYEQLEVQSGFAESAGEPIPATPIDQAALAMNLQWSESRLASLVKWAIGDGLLVRDADGSVRLTARGLRKARQIVRNHRLWEMYLIRHADIAASHVDHTADLIEHVLDEGIIGELEQLVQDRSKPLVVPDSPHRISAGVEEVTVSDGGA